MAEKIDYAKGLKTTRPSGIDPEASAAGTFLNPNPSGSVRAYKPTWRDELALLVGKILPEQTTEGLVGSRGIGSTGMGLVDFTPAGIPLAADEANRAAAAGNVGEAALDLAGVVPLPAGKMAKGAKKAAKGGSLGEIIEAAGKGAADLPSPSIAGKGTAADRAAFEASHKLFGEFDPRETPPVEQFPLERNVPKKPSARMEDLMNNEKVRKEMLKGVQRGWDEGAYGWYYSEPVRQRFIDELGPEEGLKAYREDIGLMGDTSPRNPPEQNRKSASYLYHQYRQGIEPPQPDTLKQPFPEGYGGLAQQNWLRNLHERRAAGMVDTKNKPKTPSYAEDIYGNYRPGAMDTHATRAPAMLARDPRWLMSSFKADKEAPTIQPRRMVMSGEMSMDEALARPAYWESKPSEATEYGPLEDYYLDLARRLNKVGLVAPVQAGAWHGFGKLTGRKGAGAPTGNMEFFSRAIFKTADALGLKPQQVLSKFIKGDLPLKAIIGTAGVGAAAAAAGHGSEEGPGDRDYAGELYEDQGRF